MALEDVSKFALVSVVLSTVAFLEHIIGFGAPFWTITYGTHTGLWKSCTNGYCTAFVGNTMPSKYYTTNSLKLYLINKYI